MDVFFLFVRRCAACACVTPLGAKGISMCARGRKREEQAARENGQYQTEPTHQAALDTEKEKRLCIVKKCSAQEHSVLAY